MEETWVSTRIVNFCTVILWRSPALPDGSKEAVSRDRFGLVHAFKTFSVRRLTHKK